MRYKWCTTLVRQELNFKIEDLTSVFFTWLRKFDSSRRTIDPLTIVLLSFISLRSVTFAYSRRIPSVWRSTNTHKNSPLVDLALLFLTEDMVFFVYYYHWSEKRVIWFFLLLHKLATRAIVEIPIH